MLLAAGLVFSAGFGLLLTMLAIYIGGSSVPFGPRYDTPGFIRLDWFILDLLASAASFITINCAAHLPVLDRLFATYHMPVDRWPQEHGVVGDKLPKGMWRQFLYPFQRKQPAPPVRGRRQGATRDAERWSLAVTRPCGVPAQSDLDLAHALLGGVEEHHVVDVGDARPTFGEAAMEVAFRHRRHLGDRGPALPAVAAGEDLRWLFSPLFEIRIIAPSPSVSR